MITPVTVDEVCAFLKQRGIDYELRDVDHGRQIKARTPLPPALHDAAQVRTWWLRGGKKGYVLLGAPGG